AIAVWLGRPGEILREPPRLTQRVLARGRVRLGAACVRNARAVAERPDAIMPADAKELVDLDAAPVVERQAQLAEQRICTHACRPHERVRRYPHAVAENRLVGGDRRERRADMDLDTALGQLA